MRKIDFVAMLVSFVITVTVRIVTNFSSIEALAFGVMGAIVFYLVTIFLSKRRESKDSQNSEPKKKTKQEKLLEQFEGKATLTWEEIFMVFENLGARHPIIIQHLPTMSLLGIVKISHLKKQIVWSNDALNLALFILEENIRAEFDDKELVRYLQVLEEIIKEAHNADTKDYVGSKNLFEKIKSECRKSFELLAEDFKRA